MGGVCLSAGADDSGSADPNKQAAEADIENDATPTPAEPAPLRPPVIAEEATPAQPNPFSPPASDEQNAGPPPAEPSPFVPRIFTEENAGTDSTDSPLVTPLVNSEEDTSAPAADPSHMAPIVDTEEALCADTHPIPPPAEAEEDAVAPPAAPLPAPTPSTPPPVAEQGVESHRFTPPAAPLEEAEGLTPLDIQEHLGSPIAGSAPSCPLPYPPANMLQEPAAIVNIDGDDAFAEWMSSGKHALPCLQVPITVQVCLNLQGLFFFAKQCDQHGQPRAFCSDHSVATCSPARHHHHHQLGVLLFSHQQHLLSGLIMC